ncbi:trypsin-1-like [Cimex lectularius]|uniref:Peptidase S1 domain-containing protein n=1 Tax=Cimex lectularius TaxID=79782 RepID=A0A8I6SBG2_CIMLE|nr:trypsin-1-like [Cimex lectularius]
MWNVITVLLGVFDHGFGDDDKIWGGRNAKHGEFPFAVFITGNLFCGGGLLTLDKIVSAGHCFVQWDEKGKKVELDLKRTIVIGGMVNYLKRNLAYQQTTIRLFKMHDNYRKRKDGSYYHDVAVAKLNESFLETLTLKRMPIPQGGKSEFKRHWDRLVASGNKCYAMGWGTTAKGGTEPSPSMMVIQVALWSEQKCKETAWDPEDSVTKFGEVCASSVETGETFCDGDSGSPLYCDGYVYGLATANWECGNTVLPQYFLLFWHYLDLMAVNLDNSAIDIHFEVRLILIPVVVFFTQKEHKRFKIFVN